MARTLLSGIAIAAGTGLAIGYGFTFGRRAHSRKGRPASFRETAAVRASLESMDERLTTQAREIELLRLRAAENEELAEAEIRSNERRFKEAAIALPGEIEAIIVPRVEEMRSLNNGVSSSINARIDAIENKLSEHSASFAELSQQASQSDANLQRLVRAVERLCEQHTPEVPACAAPEPEPELAPERAFFELPLDRHVKQEAAAELPSPVRRRMVREEEPSRRPRVSLAHVVFGAAAAIVGARFLR